MSISVSNKCQQEVSATVNRNAHQMSTISVNNKCQQQVSLLTLLEHDAENVALSILYPYM